MEHILDWEKEERLNDIDSFVKLTLQIHNLAAQKQITLVQTQPTTAYIKTGRRVGRPSKKDEIAKSNTKIDHFFSLVAPTASAY